MFRCRETGRTGGLIYRAGSRVFASGESRLAAEPPLLDIAIGGERAGIDAAQLLWRDEERRRREPEVVRLFFVEQPVQGVVALLPGRLAAISGGRRPGGVDRLVGVGVREGAEVVAHRLLRGVRDRRRVPDPVRVRLDAQLPADDPG